MLSSPRRALVALLPLFALAAGHEAAAATTCVNTAAALQAALSAAQNNNQDDLIQVVASNYNFGASLNINIADGYALTIEGGYAAGCASAPSAIPDNTIITGANGTFLRLATYAGGITLRNLTLSGFKPAAGTNAIVVADSYGGDTLRLENLSVSGNGVNGINDSILQVYPAGGLVFHDNVVHDNANALAAVHIQSQYPGLPIAIANNTVTANAGPGLSLQVYSELPTVLSNNILWNNATSDLIVDSNVGNERPAAFNNTWLNCSGCAFLSQASANNLTSDPKLTTSAPKYRLGATSPAINSGVPVPMTLTALDAAGNARNVGSAPDRGAYETATNDIGPAHTYVVTSSGDDANNLLTLRGAITAANNAGVPAYIRIHIAASCPQVVSLATPLPPIAVPMIIDGYADPNAAPNTSPPGPAGDIGFNATLCAILVGSSSPTPLHALSVASNANTNVHLDVRGVRFENFQHAIDLSGGIGNWIHGNAFAGPFIFNTVLGNGIGVYMDGGFADVIGGPALADVNLIGGSSGLGGVLISGGIGSVENWYHTVSNNSVGADPTGNTDASFGNTNSGIVLQNTQQHTISANWIVANGGDGILIDGGAYDLVQSNKIGSNLSSGLGNAGMGVRLRGGAANNWIGSTDPLVADGGNEIKNNGGAGVLVDLDASSYNQVTANASFNNGGLAIDLAQLGASADTGTESSGPDHLLHKPHIASATYAPSSKINVSGSIVTSQANTYRYLTLYASSRCGGDALSEIGTYALQANAAGLITFNLSVPQPGFGPAYITGTAEGYTAGATDTSEISNSRRIAASDDVFYDSFDCY